MAGCFPEKPRLCLSEQVCEGSKVKCALNGPEDWILCYIKTCLYFTLIYSTIRGTQKHGMCHWQHGIYPGRYQGCDLTISDLSELVWDTIG